MEDDLWPFKKKVEVIIDPIGDNSSIVKLKSVLDHFGAELEKKTSMLAGSTDIFIAIYRVGSEKITVRFESTEGLVLHGVKNVVERIKDEFHQKT